MQDFWNWFLAVWPLLLAVAILYVAKHFFPAWIRRSAEFGFDAELEKLRGEISRSETRLKAELEAAQRELESLRTAALSGATSRQIALENKRLEAAQGIWNAVVDLGKLKYSAEFAGSLKLSEIAKRIAAGEKNVKQFIDAVLAPINIEKLPGADAARFRPFVSAGVWAAYAAYSAILHISVVRLKMAQVGMIDADDMMKIESLNKILGTALPQYKAFVDQHGLASYHLFVEELENLVLTEIKNMLEGKEVDAAAIEKSANILKAVNAAHVKPAPKVPA
jgi:hypothetical protein